jgi:DNA-binding XRE family transcriptional regulator
VAKKGKDRTVEELMGRVIRYRRKKLDLTQEELAHVAGLSRHAVQQYERGKREPKISVGIQLARAVGLTLDDLVSQSSWDPPEPGRTGRWVHEPDPQYPPLPPGRSAGKGDGKSNS